jgi:hypothetical protein
VLKEKRRTFSLVCEESDDEPDDDEEEEEERDFESELEESDDEARECFRLESGRRSLDRVLSIFAFFRLADSDRSRFSFFLLLDLSCNVSLRSLLESRLS